MSGPNASYDPVQVAIVGADHVEAMVADALAAFAAATTAAELKEARLAHAATVRRSLWPTGRSAPCRRRPARRPAPASARPAARINAALQQREAEINEAELARILVEERVDVTLPVQPIPAGRGASRSPP